MLCQDAFRVKLDAKDGPGCMADGHDLTIGCKSVHDQRLRQVARLDRQRMIAHDLIRLWQTLEERAAVMSDLADLAVANFLRRHDLAALGCANALMPQTDAQNRQFGIGFLDELDADARFLGRAGAGRQDNAVRIQRQRGISTKFIIANDLGAGANFFQVMDQVPGETVIIVDDEDMFRTGN